jgi:hypothetical protein
MRQTRPKKSIKDLKQKENPIKQSEQKEIPAETDTKLDNVLKKYTKEYEIETKKIEKEFVDPDKDSAKAYLKHALLQAEKAWLSLKVVVSTREGFMMMTDDEKLNLFRQEFKDFQDNFPIVMRYMVCRGQYSRKAFRQFIELCSNKLSHNDPSKRSKTHMREQWIECQAGYVTYLWESQQKRRYTRQESMEIWRQAKNALTKEFSDFEKMHGEMKTKVETDKKRYKLELFKEIQDRVMSKQQSIKDPVIVDKLYNLIYKQRRRKVLRDLLHETKLAPATVTSKGTNQEGRQDHEEELKLKKMKAGGMRIGE